MIKLYLRHVYERSPLYPTVDTCRLLFLLVKFLLLMLVDVKNLKLTKQDQQSKG